MTPKPLSETHPALAAEWHPTLNGDKTPNRFSAGSGVKVWWLGKCGHEWESIIKNRKTRGCRYCSGQGVLKGFNDLATTHPELAAEWHPTLNPNLTPDKVSAGSGEKVWWLGKCGHEWESVIGTRSAGRRCRFCSRNSGNSILKGFNDLATTHPELAAEWHPTKNEGLLPTAVSYGSKNSVWWLGKCGHEYESAISNRSGKGYSCGYCSGKKSLAGVNDLATTHPELAAEWDYSKNSISPEERSYGSEDRVWWLGACGHSWRAIIGDRGSGGKGCPKCAKGGFSSVNPSKMYFIHNEGLSAFKIGITNSDSKYNRLKLFLDRGWQLLATWENPSGRIILDVETQFLRWLRLEMGIPQLLDKSSMGAPQGASETFSDSILTQAEVIAKIEELLDILKGREIE